MIKQFSLILFFTATFMADNVNGQALFQGLNHPINARAWGMGSAAASQSKAGSGSLYNPASIVHSPQLWQINQTTFPLDIQSTSAYSVFSIPLEGQFALMVNYLNYGSFTERNWEGQETGSFSVYDVSSMLAYARKISRRLSIGMSTILTQSRLNSLSAQAVLGSVGLLYYDETSTLAIGFSYRNFNIVMDSYLGADESMSSTSILGISKKLAHLPMILSVDVYQAYENEYAANIGGEFILGDHLLLRWGNSTKRFSNRGQESLKNFFSSASAGIGINFRTFIFDLAVVSLSDAGYLSSVSISQLL